MSVSGRRAKQPIQDLKNIRKDNQSSKQTSLSDPRPTAFRQDLQKENGELKKALGEAIS